MKITVREFARKHGILEETARRRLNKMVSEGIAPHRNDESMRRRRAYYRF